MPPTIPSISLDGVSVVPVANVYFDGKCISHTITLTDGSRKSIGVILPATLTFQTDAPEIMACVAGSCEYKLPNSDVWQVSEAGHSFCIPAKAKFEIRVTAPYHYICHFG